MRNLDKALRFPLAGVSENFTYRDATYPSEERSYSTPMAVNVIGTDAIEGRVRGGSRPGLKQVEGVVYKSRGEWLWPATEGQTGDNAIAWIQDTSADHNINYNVQSSATLADGTPVTFDHRNRTIYRDRRFKTDGAVWMASATRNHNDFDFGKDGDVVTRAVAGTLARVGVRGEPITALCPIGDARIYIATRRALGVIEGEPTDNFTILTENTGIVSADAWCNADGTLYFLGEMGLYAVSEGTPILVSENIPESLKGLSSAVLVYDSEHRAVHILGTANDWLYEIDQKAFWPVSYPSLIRPVSGGNTVIGGVNTVLFRSADSRWHYLCDDKLKDGGTDNATGTAIASKVAIGPFKCSQNDDTDGMLDRLTATLAETSAAVTISVYMASAAERSVKRALAVGGTPDATFTADAGWNHNIRCRCRGAWATLVLSASGRWAYESILAHVKLLGGLRHG